MQVQSTSNYQPANKQAFGMNISSTATKSLKAAISGDVIGKRLGAKIVGAMENLKSISQPERYSLYDVVIKKDSTIPPYVSIYDSEAKDVKRIYHFFKSSIPGTLKKLENTEYLEKMMQKDAARKAKYAAEQQTLTDRLNNLKTVD